MAIPRPAPRDYNRFYRRYVDLVPDGDLLATLSSQMTETQVLLSGIGPEREEYRYAPDKWSIREVVGHCIDTERVFAFRTLWIARGASGGQPGMDQDQWALASNAARRPLTALANEWAGLRRDLVAMLGSIDPEALERVGLASRRKIKARALPWMIAGHELHHRGLLIERYGVGEITGS